MNTQKTCEFGSYFLIGFIVISILSRNSNFTHMEQIQNCIFYQYFASPSLTRDQFACPVFCLQTRIFCHKYILDCKPEYFITKIFFCLPITFGDEYFCLQAEISFHNFVCPRTATFADLLMNIFACKIVK